MKTCFLLLLFVVFFSGCDNVNRESTNYQIFSAPVTEICLNGVVYYNTGRYLAPKFDKTSKIVTCEE